MTQMSFFLLSKGADGTLSLLSAASFDSRQDALAELSRLTSLPEFDSWDREVLVIDMDAGTPVLLVRPTSAADVAAESAGDQFEAAGTEPPQADVPADEALAAVIEDLGVDEEATQEDESTMTEPEDEPIQAEVESAQPEDAFVAEAEDAPVVEVDEAWAAAVVHTDTDALKGALKRTAAQMEAQGISAPESVGPAPEDSSDQEDSSAEDVESDQPSGAEPEIGTEPEAEPLDAAPDDEPDGDDLPQAEEDAVAESVDEAVAPAWPWDTGSGGLSALEEPGLDTESMIRALADDEASRTVVLGEYDGSDIASTEPELLVSAAAIEAATEPPVDQPPVEPPAVEPSAIVSAPAEAADLPADALIIETAIQTVPEAPDGGAEVSAEETSVASAAPDSDFVDLGEAVVPDAKGYEPGEVDISGMTCDDCVYVDTCPNKDERIPSTCGSFQWK